MHAACIVDFIQQTAENMSNEGLQGNDRVNCPYTGILFKTQNKKRADGALIRSFCWAKMSQDDPHKGKKCIDIRAMHH
jgi:hypothetical protein